MTERLKKAMMGIAAFVALALGAAALAQAGGSGEAANSGQTQERSDDSDRGESETESESGDESVTGSGADKATAAALKVTGGGTANSVERDSENGAVWEVEVTKPDGNTVDVRLDGSYDLVVAEADGEE